MLLGRDEMALPAVDRIVPLTCLSLMIGYTCVAPSALTNPTIHPLDILLPDLLPVRLWRPPYHEAKRSSCCLDHSIVLSSEMAQESKWCTLTTSRLYSCVVMSRKAALPSLTQTQSLWEPDG